MEARTDVNYELVETHPLPSVDVTRSLQSVLLPNCSVKRYMRWYRRLIIPMTILYMISFAVAVAVLTIPASYTRSLAVVKLGLQVPLLIFGTFELRIDLLKCLASTYEFWFFSIMNLVTCFAFCLHLGDMRMIMVLSQWHGIQLTICADAKIQTKQLVFSVVLGTVYHIFLLILVSLELIPSIHEFTFFHTRSCAVTSSAFLINGLVTLIVMLARTGYRKRMTHHAEENDPRLIHFVSYRCLVRFHVFRATGPDTHLIETEKFDLTESLAQPLRMVRWRSLIAANNVMLPCVARVLSFDHGSWKPIVLQMTGFLGVTLSIVAFMFLHFSQDQVNGSLAPRLLNRLACVCTLFFQAVCFSHSQRHLLYHIVTMFDFIFHSLQLSFCVFCLCDVLYWDERCWNVLLGWIWMHCVLTSDALTPQVRQQLGLHRRYALVIVFWLVITHATLSSQLMFAEASNLQDRVLWSFSMFGNNVTIRTGPAYLSRAFTTLLWSFKITWRLVTSGEDDLLKIQGQVVFFGNPLALRRLTILPSGSQVEPLSLLQPMR